MLFNSRCEINATLIDTADAKNNRRDCSKQLRVPSKSLNERAQSSKSKLSTLSERCRFPTLTETCLVGHTLKNNLICTVAASLILCDEHFQGVGYESFRSFDAALLRSTGSTAGMWKT